jgi:hypothetical protein
VLSETQHGCLPQFLASGEESNSARLKNIGKVIVKFIRNCGGNPHFKETWQTKEQMKCEVWIGLPSPGLDGTQK